MKTKILIPKPLLFFAVFLSATTSAHAVVMTLENLAADQDTPYTEFGYSISAPGEHLHAKGNTDNFTKAAQMANDTKGMTLSKADSGKFDLLSLYAIELGAHPSFSFAIQVDGIADGAVKVSKQLAPVESSIIEFMSDWTGLDEVRFWYASSGGFGNPGGANFTFDNFEFDDISVEASVIPVPAAVWFFVSALGGLGLLRNKRTRA